MRDEDDEPEVAGPLALIAGSLAAATVVNAVAPGYGIVFAAAPSVVEVLRRARSGSPTRHVERAVADRLAVRDAVLSCTGHPAWDAWVPWPALKAHGEVPVPEHLPHPAAVGFAPTRLARDVGQVADWALPLADRSRLHAHEYGDGRLLLHRDRLDPARGPVAAMAHWTGETPEGRVALPVAAVLAAAAFAWWVTS